MQVVTISSLYRVMPYYKLCRAHKTCFWASCLLDKVFKDLFKAGILKDKETAAAFQTFLVPNKSEAARFTVDFSSWAEHYEKLTICFSM